MFKNIFILQNIIHFFVSWFRYLFQAQNYKVNGAFLMLDDEELVDITRQYKTGTREIPLEPEQGFYEVFYCFKNEHYAYCTRRENHIWPPTRVSSCCLPIIYANDGEKDVLKLVKKYAGPYNDFHQEEVKVSDLRFEKLILKNVIGQTVELKKDDIIYHQTLWSPNKISSPQG